MFQLVCQLVYQRAYMLGSELESRSEYLLG